MTVEEQEAVKKLINYNWQKRPRNAFYINYIDETRELLPFITKMLHDPKTDTFVITFDGEEK